MIYSTEATIKASPEQVWDALTNPDKIAIYMYGAETVSSWKVGDRVEFYMELEGKRSLVVNGDIQESQKPELLVHTLFPSNWGMEDIPQNYIDVRYEIEAHGDGSTLRITQSGFENAAQGEKRYQDVAKGWEVTLPKLIEVAEAS